MKPNYIIHSTILAISIAASTASAAVILGPVVNPSNGHTYYLLDDTTWQSGESSSISLGGHLATINDAVEQAWVFNMFGTVGAVDRSLWIGLNDVSSEGTFVWSSGEPVTYTNWEASNPSNSFGVEDWVHMHRSNLPFAIAGGTWNDAESPNPVVENFPFASVTEIVPEPSSTVFLISGALICLRRRSLRTYERSA